MRIFIVDDSHLLGRQLTELLSELEGVEIVGQAQGVKEALAAIRALRPNVVTLDIHLTDGSGLELLKRIKREGLKTLVIMLTNLASPPYRTKCLQAGADFFFDKAIEINEVKRIVGKLLPSFKKTEGPC